MTTTTVIDSDGPTTLWSDGTRTTPAWGPGSLACGHVVGLDEIGDGDYVEDIGGTWVCIECWNANVRNQRQARR